MNLFEARKILELHGGESESDIKKNYRKLILEYHPDKCKDPDAQDKFIKLNQAYSFIQTKQTNFIVEIKHCFTRHKRQISTMRI